MNELIAKQFEKMYGKSWCDLMTMNPNPNLQVFNIFLVKSSQSQIQSHLIKMN